jgi:hypothetical protein
MYYALGRTLLDANISHCKFWKPTDDMLYGRNARRPIIVAENCTSGTMPARCPSNRSWNISDDLGSVRVGPSPL